VLGVRLLHREVVQQMRPLVDEPRHPSPEVGQLLQQIRFDGLDGEERDQPDE